MKDVIQLNSEGLVHGASITLAREVRGMSMPELSKKSKVNHGRLSKMEFGFIQPTKEELKCLSETLKFPEPFFFRDIKPIAHYNFNCSVCGR